MTTSALVGVTPAAEAAATTGSLAPENGHGGIQLSAESVTIRPGGTLIITLPAGLGVATRGAVLDDDHGSNPPVTVVSHGRTLVATTPTGMLHPTAKLYLDVNGSRAWPSWEVVPYLAIDVELGADAPATATTRVTAEAFATVAEVAPVPGQPLTVGLPAEDEALGELGRLTLTGSDAVFGPLYTDRDDLTAETADLGLAPSDDGRTLSLTVPGAYPLAKYPANEKEPYLLVNAKGAGDVKSISFYAEATFERATGATIGLGRVVRGGPMTFYLPTQTHQIYPMTRVVFGRKGDVPLRGDWDGDGKATVGVYRPSAGAFLLASADRDGGGRLTTVKFGAAGDVPVVGRFAVGSKADVVGLYRPSTQTFFLGSANRSGGGKVRTVKFGRPGDLPLAGNWNGAGDGVARVGLFRPSTGRFLLASANTDGGGTVATVAFGQKGDRPLAGDWDGDGKVDVGVYRRSGFLLATQGEGKSPTVSGLILGRPTDLPLAYTP